MEQWFPNFSGTRTTKNILVLLEPQNIDLYWDSRTTWASLADHFWSTEQTLGNTALEQQTEVRQSFERIFWKLTIHIKNQKYNKHCKTKMSADQHNPLKKTQS